MTPPPDPTAVPEMVTRLCAASTAAERLMVEVGAVWSVEAVAGDQPRLQRPG